MAKITSTRTGLVRIIEKILLLLLVFLIPSNLAFHLPAPNAIIDGILVDYLIPKLYLTDILIISLLVLWLIKNIDIVIKKINNLFRRSGHKKSKRKLLTIVYWLVAFFSVTLIKIPFSQNPTAAFFFWLKLVELAFLIWYLRHHIYDLRSTIYPALGLSVAFQSILALSQWIRQSSLTPYWLLGESQFTALTPGIAKASFFGYLKVLPMGTTPHPNILAGFLAISITLIFAIKTSRVNHKYSTTFENASKYIMLILASFVLLLTQSLTAIIILAVSLAFIIIISPNSLPSTHNKSLPKILIALGLSLLTIWVLVSRSSILESTSLSRRQTLNTIAIKMIRDRPLFGIGLNNFTAVMKNYGEVESTTRFFQPVHNIYLLVVSETGLIGFVILSLIILSYIKNTKYSIQNTIYFVPILMLLTIGLADHYPLTLQTGQLLTSFAIGLSLSAKNKSTISRR